MAGQPTGYSASGREVVLGPDPVVHAGDLALAGDIRLDNGPDLFARLGIRTDQAPTDARLVLAAYARWGERALEHLYGDFAFGLWDGRRQMLLCVRDALGARPLYYYLSPGLLAFASEAAPLLHLPEVPHRLNRAAITDFLAARFDDHASTGYLDVVRLPPGHALAVDRTQHRLLTHWTPDATTELRLPDDGAYEEAFRHTVLDAVRSRLATGPMGVSLSGGLDSSAIACLAGAAGAEPLLAYTAVFDDEPRSDERVWADAAALRSGATSRHCHPARTSPLADWAGSPWKGPAPECSPQVAVCRVTLEAAAADGVGVVLHGFGGDSVVSHGYRYLTELVGTRQYLKAARETEAVVRRNGKDRRSVWMGHTIGPFLPPGAVAAWRSARPRGRPPAPALVRPEVFAATHPDGAPHTSRARTSRQDHVADVGAGIVSAVIEASRRVDACVGVERRYPFLDRRLVELCLSLPGDQKLRGGWTRSILRRALDGIMPDEVRDRTGKGDLNHAFAGAIASRDMALVNSVVARPGRLSEWVEPSRLVELRDRCAAGGGGNDWFALWRAVVVAQWLSHHGFDEART